MNYVECTGTETSIDDCPHDNGGTCTSAAVIKCRGTIFDFYCWSAKHEMSRTLIII